MEAKKIKKLSKKQLNRKKKDDVIAELLDTYAQLEAQEGKTNAVSEELKTAQAKLVALQQPAEAMHPANATEVQASKSSLRIDLYPHQQQYRGKLEHILSGDRLLFTREDQKAVFDFFEKHKPLLDEDLELAVEEDFDPMVPAETEEPKPSPTSKRAIKTDRPATPASRLQPEPKKVALAATTEVPAQQSSAILKSISLFSRKMNNIENRVSRQEPFNARLTLDLSTIPEELGDQIAYTIEIYAKRLGTNENNTLLTRELGSTPRTDTLSVETPAMKLSTGKYRLETVVSFSEENNPF